MRRPSVFIAYAWKDDQPFVERLYNDLERLGYDPWMDKKNMPSRGRTLPQEVVSKLNDCDRVVAVIGPEALKSEACQAERDYAFDKGKVFTAILRPGDYKSLPPQVSTFFVPDVRASRPYKVALDEFLRVLADRPVIPGRLFDVPPPPHLQHRPEEVRALCDALTAKKLKPIAVTSPGCVGLQGMGGVGKTVVAALAARDYTVRRTFKDGIIWLTLGQRPDLPAELRQAGAALREDIAAWTSETLARTRLSEALENKECLLILDDLWNVPDAESFRGALSPSCTLLVTTRNLDVVRAIGAEPLQLGLLTDDQALELLARWSGQSTSTLMPEARRVASECGNLPLALAMIGAMVGPDSRRWANALYKLESADLEKVHQQFPDYPYPNLMLAIEVSVEALGTPLRERYLDLAVFKRIPWCRSPSSRPSGRRLASTNTRLKIPSTASSHSRLAGATTKAVSACTTCNPTMSARRPASRIFLRCTNAC